MADLNFPTSPTIGDKYIHEGITYEWTGIFWDVVAVSAPAASAAPFAIQVDGDAVNPAFFFSSDPSTGFYLKAAGVLGLTISGVEVAYFDAAGVHSTGVVNATGNIGAFTP